MIQSKLLRSIMRPGKRTSCFARSALLAFIAMTALGGLCYPCSGYSSTTGAGEIDGSGVRIGVSKGSTSERALTAKFKNGRIVSAENVKVAVEMLRRAELDTYATNKPTLFEMSDSMP